MISCSINRVYFSSSRTSMSAYRNVFFVLNCKCLNGGFSKAVSVLNLKRNILCSDFKRHLFLTTNVNTLIPFNLTDIGEGITEVVIKEWFVKEDQHVSQFDNICEVQSDKASVTVTSRYDGIIKKIHYKVEETAFVGKPLVDIETDEESTKQKVIVKHPNGLQKEKNINRETLSGKTHLKDDLTVCKPYVRSLAKSKDVNLLEVKGSGKNGQILKEDVLKYVDQKYVDVQKARCNREEIVPLTAFQTAMMKTMTASLTVPHLLYCDEISITKLLEKMKETKMMHSKLGLKVTLTAYLIKAISNALKNYPILNATLNENSRSVTIKYYHNIGIAMDTALGLAVPVMKHVENMSLLDISRNLQQLTNTGKKGNFKNEDLNGGTFVISNIGAIGGTYAAPIIVNPQLAIAAFGSVKAVPRFNQKMEIVRDDIINISISADHRVIDGATVALFTKSVKIEIENSSNETTK